MAHHITHNRIDYHAYIDKEMGFQRRSERLNGVLLLDALAEDIAAEGSETSKGSLAVRLCLGIPGPGNTQERARC